MRWLILNQDGSTNTVVMDKRQFLQVQSLEIPMRDMRLLDPVLQYETYGQLLVRDNALVFCMEKIRLIIMADKALLPLDYEKCEQMDRFITLLESVIKERSMHEDGSRGSKHQVYESMFPDALELPFELQVLEVALGEVCKMLQQQVKSLESLAHPALEDLTRTQDTVNLERVRKIKTQHQRLTGRVQMVREVLERYMQDDQDMLRMCLTRRAEQDLETGSDSLLMPRLSSVARVRSIPFPHLRQGTMMNTLTSPSPHGLSGYGFEPGIRNTEPRASMEQTSDSDAMHDFYEVENLLESYFALVDTSHQKLVSLGEYIDDTEDFINIELDFNRNKLLRLEILITVATFALAFYNLIAGILGENLVLPEIITQNLWGFIGVNGTMCFVCVSVFFGLYWSMRHKKLI